MGLMYRQKTIRVMRMVFFVNRKNKPVYTLCEINFPFLAALKNNSRTTLMKKYFFIELKIIIPFTLDTQYCEDRYKYWITH
jgi:hypothetical protein